MSKNKWVSPGNRVMDIAYIRDGNTFHTGEALLLACLVNAKGKSRKGKDFADVQRLMKDQNADKKSKK